MGAGARASMLGLVLACLAACAPHDAQSSATGGAADAGMPSSPSTTAVPAAPAPAESREPAARAPSEPSADALPADGVAAPESLLTTCRTDTDCAVKDVGGCCGYRPACVNRDVRTDPAAAQARCAREGRVGICGFREIDHCQCLSGTCRASPGADGPAPPVGLQ